MADLKPLIRLRRHAVDEKQKAVADIYRQIEGLEARRNDLQHQLETERSVLEQNPQVEMLAYFGRFSDAVMKGVERINGQIRKLETHLRLAQEEMRTAFAEFKKVEIVQRNRAQAARNEAAMKETNELDEIGIEGFRRNEENQE